MHLTIKSKLRLKSDGWFRSKILRPNGNLDIKAKKLGEGVLRPNGNLDIKAKKTGQGSIRQNG